MNRSKIIFSTVLAFVMLASQVIAVGAAPVAQEDHPVGFSLAQFFTDLLGVDYDTIMEYHKEGAGFGTIAQALWMTNALEGDTTTFAAIVEAKMNNDYSSIMKRLRFQTCSVQTIVYNRFLSCSGEDDYADLFTEDIFTISGDIYMPRYYGYMYQRFFPGGSGAVGDFAF